MPGQTLGDYDLIYPRNGMWGKLRLPPFPPSDSVLAVAPQELKRELAEAFEVISLVEKNDGPRRTRRSIDGVNRVAQHRWPERRIHVDLVYDLLTAWQMAGTEAVVELVAGGKEERQGHIGFKKMLRNSVREMAAVFHEPPIGSEVFVSVPTIVRLRDNLALEPRIFLVSVVAHFGQYRFCLASLEPPGPDDVDIYCCWHTRIVQETR